MVLRDQGLQNLLHCLLAYVWSGKFPKSCLFVYCPLHLLELTWWLRKFPKSCFFVYCPLLLLELTWWLGKFPKSVCLFSVLYFCWQRFNLMIEMGLFQNPVRFSQLHIFMLYICERTMNWCWMPWMFASVLSYPQICVFPFLSSAEKGSSLMVDDSQSFPTTTMPRTTVGQCVTWNCINCSGRSQENLI